MRFAILAALLASTSLVFAEDCPPGSRSCKIVTITDEELQTLVGPNMILDMATWASRPLGDIANAWKKKIEASPPGTVKEMKPTAPPPEAK